MMTPGRDAEWWVSPPAGQLNITFHSPWPGVTPWYQMQLSVTGCYTHPHLDSQCNSVPVSDQPYPLSSIQPAPAQVYVPAKVIESPCWYSWCSNTALEDGEAPGEATVLLVILLSNGVILYTNKVILLANKVILLANEVIPLANEVMANE